MGNVSTVALFDQLRDHLGHLVERGQEESHQLGRTSLLCLSLGKKSRTNHKKELKVLIFLGAGSEGSVPDLDKSKERSRAKTRFTERCV